MPHIVKVEPSKRKKGRWLAHLDDGTILRMGENELVSFGLYAGMALTQEQLSQVAEGVACATLRNRALNILSARPHSRKELQRKLLRRERSDDREDDEEQLHQHLDTVLNRLEDLGLINDGEYANMLVQHYQRRGYGQMKIKDELYRRGVPRECWDDALATMECSNEAIDNFVAKKLAGKEPSRENLKKTADALARRGYTWSDISQALSRYEAELDE